MFTAAGITNPLARQDMARHLPDAADGQARASPSLPWRSSFSTRANWYGGSATRSLNQVMDALPLQRWVLFCSKLFTLMLVQVLVVLLILAAGLVVQVAQGYYHFEFGLYFRELFLNRLIAAVDSLRAGDVRADRRQQQVSRPLRDGAVHRRAPSRCLRQDFRIISTASDKRRQVTYSDINGYGPFLQPLVWFRIYWAIAAILLAIVTNLLWVRGTESSWRVRMNLVVARFSRATAGWSGHLCRAAAFAPAATSSTTPTS